EVEQGDPCSFSGKMYRHRSAYAAVGAGDHRHPALQLARTAVLLGDEYRLRAHAPLGSRTLLLMLSRGCLLVSHDLPRLSSRLPWDRCLLWYCWGDRRGILPPSTATQLRRSLCPPFWLLPVPLWEPLVLPPLCWPPFRPASEARLGSLAKLPLPPRCCSVISTLPAGY